MLLWHVYDEPDEHGNHAFAGSICKAASAVSAVEKWAKDCFRVSDGTAIVIASIFGTVPDDVEDNLRFEVFKDELSVEIVLCPLVLH